MNANTLNMPVKRKRADSTETRSDAESDALSQQDAKASKDRECPFCHQAFTSSSLGRHLDLYIRPVNPKRPDGVHNVDEIRRIRGGITRRQPKGAGKSKDLLQQSSEHSAQGVASDAGSREEERQGSATRQLPKPTRFVNGMDWRSTGVITDMHSPLTVSRHGEHSNRRTPGPQLPPLEVPSPVTKQHDGTIEEQIETGKAAELALREVLGSLAAAKHEHDAGSLFDGVDLCTLSFPTLCLTVLPPPRTLFSTRPFPDAESFSLQPPLEREKQCLLLALDRRRLPRRVFEHVDVAYDQWMQLDDHERMSTWVVEVLRSQSKAQSSVDELNTQLSLARQRIAHLEHEFELLSRCQLPRERIYNPPTTLPITKPVLSNLHLEGSPEHLIDKWRSTIRAVARPKKSTLVTSSSMNYADSAIRAKDSNSAEPGTMSIPSDMIIHGAVYGVGGPMSRHGQFV